MIATLLHPSPKKSFPERRGFSFVEVLFAVMILGIGFIMVAGIFPVAMSQTAATQEDTVGAAIVRGGVATVSSISYSERLIPNTGEVVRFTDDLMLVDPVKSLKLGSWPLIKQNQILPEDSRFAWIALAKREVLDARGQAPAAAELIVIPVQVRDGRSNFDQRDLAQTGSGNSAHGNLMPLAVRVNLIENGDNPDICQIVSNSGPGVEAAAPGAVIVIARGNDSSGRLAAGRIYRLGNATNNANEFQLLPGSDMLIDPETSARENITNADAWIVGRGLQKPGAGAPVSFTGNSMPIGVYTTYINLK